MKNKSINDNNEGHFIQNNEPSDLLKSNSKDHTKEGNLRIFRLKKSDEKEKFISNNFTWDITKGDYKSDPDQIPKKFIKKVRFRLEIAYLVVFIILVALLILLISTFMAEKV